ncbi:MAG: FHA domain-containing protein, partial [Planctomycetaceae bacterium]|nr:FHA domain-containing protein [Planctomycetaceae bacterium]
DERISRYHLKIHENGGAIILTDLQSTNGTRVNGEVISVWRLRPGDIISAGRSIMVFGSTEEIATRLATLAKQDKSASVPMGVDGEEFNFLSRSLEHVTTGDINSSMFDVAIFRGLSPKELSPLHLLAPPQLPTGLQPKHAAQMTELLQYLQIRLRYLVASVKPEQTSTKKKENDNSESDRVTVAADQWQNIIDLYDKIAKYLNSISEP